MRFEHDLSDMEVQVEFGDVLAEAALLGGDMETSLVEDSKWMLSLIWWSMIRCGGSGRSERRG